MRARALTVWLVYQEFQADTPDIVGVYADRKDAEDAAEACRRQASAEYGWVVYGQARLRLLGSDELLPGELGWIQLEMVQPVVCVRGDRYILRRPSPGETLGGGKILDPHPGRRHRRFSADLPQRLQDLQQGTPEDVLQQALNVSGALALKELVTRSNLPSEVAIAAIYSMADTGLLIDLDASSQTGPAGYRMDDLLVSLGLWEQLISRTVQEIAAHHKRFPLRMGLPREELACTA